MFAGNGDCVRGKDPVSGGTPGLFDGNAKVLGANPGLLAWNIMK